jgi:hypothetical protein
MNFEITLILGLPFSIIAFFMVFLITYGEYSHHFAEKNKIFKHSIEAGLFAFVTFIIITTIIAFSLNKMFPTN